MAEVRVLRANWTPNEKFIVINITFLLFVPIGLLRPRRAATDDFTNLQPRSCQRISAFQSGIGAVPRFKRLERAARTRQSFNQRSGPESRIC